MATKKTSSRDVLPATAYDDLGLVPRAAEKSIATDEAQRAGCAVHLRCRLTGAVIAHQAEGHEGPGNILRIIRQSRTPAAASELAPPRGWSHERAHAEAAARQHRSRAADRKT